jgi:hypothetical protein
MPVWTIAGEAAKAWDATAQTMEYRQISDAELTFQSIGVDELILGITTQSLASYTPPELGQVIKIYRSGTLFFTGTVTDIQSQNTSGLSITVSGPWWWLDRIAYTTPQTDSAGSTADRLTGVFGTAGAGTNLKTAIETAINTAVALGAPMANIAGGSAVATYFDLPRITLNQASCSGVLTELLRIVPDTMTYFDYSTATPTLQVTRRGVATAVDLTVGTSPIDAMTINPVFELKVNQVVLPYVDRDTLGRTVYQTQSSGTPSAGKIQVVTMGGPELDTFLPNDLFDKATVRTAANINEFAVAADRQFDAARALGLTTIGASLNSNAFYYSNSVSALPSTSSKYVVAASTLSNAEGDPVSATGKYFTIAENMPEWAIEENGLIPVTLAGLFYTTWISQTTYYFADGSYDDTTLYNVPNWFYAVPLTLTAKGYRGTRYAADDINLYTGPLNATGFLSSTSYHWTGTARSSSSTTKIQLAVGASSVDDYYVGLTVSWRTNPSGTTASGTFTDTITDYVGSTRLATLTSTWSSTQKPANGLTYQLQGHPLYREAEYSFLAPPAGLAANLLAAQSFIVYEGQISTTEDTAGAVRYRGKKINVIGSLTAHSTMGAMVSGETLNLFTGQTTISLGTPPRVDYRSLTERIRKTPQDNIVFV